MDVFVANEQELEVDEARLSELAHHVLVSESVDESAELSVLLVTEGHMQKLNARFAGDDHPTDVLAFPMMEDDEGPVILGDVVVCPAIAQRNAAKVSHPLTRELDVLLVHGTLHLLGYDHQASADRSKMEGRMREILEGFERASI